AMFCAFNIPQNNGRKKTTFFFPTGKLYTEVVPAVFCCEDFWRAPSGEIATCDVPHRRGARILRLLAALGKNEGKSFAGSPSFFAVPYAFVTPFSEDRARARKSAG